MKKSNVLLIALIASLYLIPLLALSVAYCLPTEECLVGFTDRFRIVRIENLRLRPEDVCVDPRPASRFPHSDLLKTDDCSYLYYEGARRYLPEINAQDSLLLVGNAREAELGEALTLHLRINCLEAIWLNGEVIWEP